MPSPVPCDVLVVGAGVAGVPAAVAAARAGARTVLVERRSFPGGLGVSALHHSVCGLYANSPGLPRSTLNAGLSSEITDRLAAGWGMSRPTRIGRVVVLPYRTSDFGSIYADLAAGTDGLEFLPNHETTAIHTDGDRISRVELASTSGKRSFAPGSVVDCTGCGTVVTRVGASVTPPREERQFYGYVVEFAGLGDPGQLPGVSVPYALRQDIAEGQLPPYMAYTAFTQGSTPGTGVCKFSLPPREGRTTESHPPPDVLGAIACLRKRLTAFRDAEVTRCSDGILERDGPRLEGRYTLTEDDVLQGRHFSATTVRAAWPIEFWEQDAGPRYTYLPDGTPFYEIPADCAISAKPANLLAAGRCLSAEPRALASARVMGTCIATGEMAGLEAARATC
jgi:hypothetical protein